MYARLSLFLLQLPNVGNGRGGSQALWDLSGTRYRGAQQGWEESALCLGAIQWLMTMAFL